jgi:hypothetical protein
MRVTLLRSFRACRRRQHDSTPLATTFSFSSRFGGWSVRFAAGRSDPLVRRAGLQVIQALVLRTYLLVLPSTCTEHRNFRHLALALSLRYFMSANRHRRDHGLPSTIGEELHCAYEYKYLAHSTAKDIHGCLFPTTVTRRRDRPLRKATYLYLPVASCHWIRPSCWCH